jgi:hypothetical protein
MKSGEGGVNGPEFKDEEHNSPGEVRERKQAGPGTVDPITSERVTGWCFRSPGDTDASYVAVCVDDVLYAPVHSNQLYEGSNAEELPFGGYVGFTFRIPRELHDGRPHILRAFVAGTGAELRGSPAQFALPVSDIAERRRFVRDFSATTIIYRSILDGLDEFVAKLSAKRRLALCCSYFETSGFGPHHVAMFDFLRSHDFVVLNVHALGGPMLVDPHCASRIDWSIVKVNKGYDFGSWQVGLAEVIDYLDLTEKLILVNDSCVGPISGNAPFFTKFLDGQETLFGLTDSYAHNYHLQSYFFGVGSDAASRDMLVEFLLDFRPTSDKAETISLGELGLGKILNERGIVPAVLCPYEQVADAWLAEVETLRPWVIDSLPICDGPRRTEIDAAYHRVIDDVVGGVPVNSSHYFWHTLLDRFHHPFVKRDLLFRNPVKVPDHCLIMHYLRQNCPRTYNQALALARTTYKSQLPPVLSAKQQQ